MRRNAAILCCASLAAVVLAPVAAVGERGQRDRCSRKGSVTLIKAPQVRVYRNTQKPEFSVVYACHRPTGRATRLGFTGREGVQYAGKHATAIRGSRIVFGVVDDPDAQEGNPGYSVRMVNLPVRGPAYRRGRAFLAVESQPFDPAADDNLAIERLLIAANRTVAYTSCLSVDDRDRCLRPASGTRVVAVPFDASNERFAKPVVLDDSPGIDPRSLRLSPSGKRLAWTRDSQTQTANLP